LYKTKHLGAYYCRGVIFMATSKKDKNESKNLRTLFSVICLSIIALGLIVYFSSQGSGKTPVGEPTSVTETTSAAAVQHRVEGVTRHYGRHHGGCHPGHHHYGAGVHAAVGYQYALQEFLQISGVRERAAKLQ
jgi:hypothetical protein